MDIDKETLDAAADLLRIASRAAGKMNASYIRREVSPRAEFDGLVDHRDEFIQSALKLEGYEPKEGK
jgi:hypothetical protein